ncbi:MAG TPA: TPM domain-containing protein, partial [Spirochaetota bacterium]|nr:TPM domain-containing protein [Spirochaetota bacterium]
MKRLALVLVYSALISLVYTQNLPELTGRVVDVTGTLSPAEKNDIEKFLENFEKSTGAQMVVAIIDTLSGYSIEDYSIKLAEKWQIGRKGIDDGVIILVSLRDRKMRIEVGYGLEGTITDVLAWKVIEKFMKPHFVNGDYYLGLKSAAIGLAKLVGYKTDSKNAYINDSKYASKIRKQNTEKLKNKFLFPVLAVCYALGLGIRRAF